jgi:CBS domain containing-hemolysin-like protein
MQLFQRVFRWPIAVLNGVGNGVLKIFGLRPAAGHEMVHSVEELRILVTGSQEAGVVEASEARIASRAFVFGELTAGALMTPRTEVEAVPPVYGGSLDNIVGVLHVHDLFVVLNRPPEAFDLGALIRPVLVAPESKPADNLLEEMRAARRQLAVVLDEFGGTAGIVTLEDLVEALVGPIEEEDLPTANEGLPLTSTVAEPDGSLVIGGRTRLGEFEELTGLRLDESDYQAAETVGGLVMARLGRIPEPGDEVALAGRTLRVERLDGKRVATVRLTA